MSGHKFNATAQQTVFLEISRGSKRYKVSHIMRPLTDEDFARLNDAALVKTKDGEISSQYDLVVNELWESKVIGIGGYAAMSDEDFKPKVPFEDRRAALRALDTGHLLFETAAEDELVPLDDNCEYKLRVMFDGNPVITKHVLKTASAEQERRRNRIVKDSMGTVGKSGEFVGRIAKLYDELVVGYEGYEGNPPSSHKFLVVEAHLTQQAATTEKN